MKTLKPEERLIVAADFKPEADVKFPNEDYASRRAWISDKVLSLAEKLEGTGVCLKVNSALRACGYDLIDSIHFYGLMVFADLKLFDIKETLSIDAILLREAKPELLTVVCSAGVDSMMSLKLELPETEILGVQVLTNLKEEDTINMFGCTINDAVLKFAKIAQLGKTDGLISSGKEVAMLKENFGEYLSLNTPAIRPLWAVVKNDDQNQKRTMTPAEAILAGADRIVVGRPITQAKDPYDAVMRTIEEIDSVNK
jgi:orotidine-5'-phosphate decarboxylase